MTNLEILEKVREAERLIIQAYWLLWDVREACAVAENAFHLKHLDQTDTKDLINNLFRLVEPHMVVGDPRESLLSIDVKNEYAPRGTLAGMRLRWEIICGLRKWAGNSSWKFPWVNPSEE